MGFMLGIVFLILTIGGGATLLYGTWHKWPWLVHPSEDFALVYSLSFVRRVFGPSALKFHNYALGIAFVLAGLLMLWNELLGK
jgi:hypothetical protein